MNKIIFTDTETTGFGKHPVFGHPQVIELGMVALDITVDDFVALELTEYSQMEGLAEGIFVQRYLPSMAIHPEASKVNGIVIEDLLGCPKSPLATEDFLKFVYGGYVIGQNIAYDMNCLGDPKDIPTLCTKKLAKAVGGKFPMPKSLSQDKLIQHFFPKTWEQHVGKIHTALGDCWKNMLLMQKLLTYFPGFKTWKDVEIFLLTVK